jgi:ABC-type antimicrobial peptide transport system permease subunit
MAVDSLKATKWRNFLTMLGIIIGVASVVTIVSIGEGVKRQVNNQINHLGSDMITIRPGKTVKRDKAGNVSGVNYLTTFSGNALTEADLKSIQQSRNVDSAVPLSFVTGTPKVQNREYTNGFIFGTTDGLPNALNQKIEFGAFFNPDDAGKNVAVIGKNVAEDLFQEQVPIGRSMQIRGENFIVLGVFEEFATTSILPGADYNTAVFIPIGAGKKINNGQTAIQQIFAKPSKPDLTDDAVKAIHDSLLNAHAGQDDFTILKQADNLAITNSILNLLTELVSGVAAISLIVGGIGIMNIMFVAVTERTREIGARKAVGATSHQILAQFIIEAAVISLIGGIIGVVCSLLANFFIRILTNLQPVTTWPVMGIAIIVALLVGMIFGVAPALNAARKDPIEALRSH